MHRTPPRMLATSSSPRLSSQGIYAPAALNLPEPAGSSENVFAAALFRKAFKH
jgi:hypothetical protein